VREVLARILRQGALAELQGKKDQFLVEHRKQAAALTAKRDTLDAQLSLASKLATLTERERALLQAGPADQTVKLHGVDSAEKVGSLAPK
jgi:hypothetical protein